jgi:hypothetical protein
MLSAARQANATLAGHYICALLGASAVSPGQQPRLCSTARAILQRGTLGLCIRVPPQTLILRLAAAAAATAATTTAAAAPTLAAVSCRTACQARLTAIRDPHLSANLACQSEGGELVAIHTLLVQVANVHLDAGMVLSCDQLVCPRAANKPYTTLCVSGKVTTRSSTAASMGRGCPGTGKA